MLGFPGRFDLSAANYSSRDDAIKVIDIASEEKRRTNISWPKLLSNILVRNTTTTFMLCDVNLGMADGELSCSCGPAEPRCTLEMAMADAIIALTSSLAIKKGEWIEFVDAWFNVESDETPEGTKPRAADQIT